MARLLRQSAVFLAIGLLALVFGKSLRADQVVFSLASLPFVMFGLIAFLGIRVHHPRMAQLAALLGFFYVWLGTPDLDATLPMSAADKRAIAAIAIPLSMSLLLALRERPLLSPISLLTTLAAALPTLLLIGINRHSAWLSTLAGWAPVSMSTSVPQIALFFCALFGAVIYWRRDAVTTGFDIGSFIALGPIFYAVGLGSRASAAVYAVAFSAAGATLLYAVFGVYWQRVYTDELTGIPNRRALNEYLKGLSGRYTIAMVDVDHFKRFNDKFGHDEGDNVLRFVAHHFSRQARGRVFRFGGEEFCVVYRRKGADRVFEDLDRARGRLAQRSFWIRQPKAVRKQRTKKDRGRLFGEKKKVSIKASIGVAERSGRTKPMGVLKEADKALYKAKRKGRNRVVCA